MVKDFGIRNFKRATLTVSLLLLASCLPQFGRPQTTPSSLTIEYLFTAETTYEKIQVSQTRLVYTYFEDRNNKCAEWIAQSPCWADEDLKTQEADLTEEEVGDLIDLIRQTNFMQLKDIYGGAAEGQRYYAYTLMVQLGGKQKEVLYQSFPENEPRPEGFQRLSDRLHELVHQKFQ